MKIIITHIILSLIFNGVALAESDDDLITKLEGMFIKADDFVFIYKYQDVPEDVRKWFPKITRSNRIANFGESYNVKTGSESN